MHQNSKTKTNSNATAYILDTYSISYKKAIAILERNKNKTATFKIIPNSSNFIIGSNSSNDRGEVIQF